jgi:hypothetical protein
MTNVEVFSPVWVGCFVGGGMSVAGFLAYLLIAVLSENFGAALMGGAVSGIFAGYVSFRLFS